MEVSDIIKRNKSNIAFVVGNGINRYKTTSPVNSWDELLVKLWNEYGKSSLKTEVPRGIALTEFYDVLELGHQNRGSKISLQKEFCALMKSWKPQEHHNKFVTWAINNKSPVLTTNFENILGTSGKCKLFKKSKGSFTDYYPWECYYGVREISSPASDFGIWHINGMQCYHRSIRLGLTHYMGSVERARSWLHQRNEGSPFSGKNRESWRGADTWLHIIFNKPLFIFGLGLEKTEVFLRWLLIERAKYFTKFPDRKLDAWYAYVGTTRNPGKEFFLKNVGVEPVRVRSYDELYRDVWDRI